MRDRLAVSGIDVAADNDLCTCHAAFYQICTLRRAGFEVGTLGHFGRQGGGLASSAAGKCGRIGCIVTTCVRYGWSCTVTVRCRRFCRARPAIVGGGRCWRCTCTGRQSHNANRKDYAKDCFSLHFLLHFYRVPHKCVYLKSKVLFTNQFKSLLIPTTSGKDGRSIPGGYLNGVKKI